MLLLSQRQFLPRKPDGAQNWRWLSNNFELLTTKIFASALQKTKT
jgi:hypothetical protein